MKTITNLDRTSDNVRKCLRPSQILKSNKIVRGIVNCLKTQFTDPFCADFDYQRLYNLVSGDPVSDGIAESMSHIEEVGNKAMLEFDERIVSVNPMHFLMQLIKSRDRHLFLLKRKLH